MAASRSSPAGVSVVFEGSREDYFPELMAWADLCEASCEGFEITSFGEEGYGLRATRDIKVFYKEREREKGNVCVRELERERMFVRASEISLMSYLDDRSSFASRHDFSWQCYFKLKSFTYSAVK